jgi:ABC-2 family transporter protein
MTWVTWRQHRNQALYGLGALAVLSLVLLVTGLHMASVYRDSGLSSCQNNQGLCPLLASAFSNRFRAMEAIGVLLMVLPLFAGVFWGAPLVARELEQGTHRLAWTQSITRTRWITTKLTAILLATTAFVAVLTAIVSWWFGPLANSDVGRMQPVAFDVQGIAPVAYTAFAVTLGVAAGALTRKTLPAMGATLAAFTATRVAVLELARPHYQPALRADQAINLNHPGSVDRAGLHDWILSQGTVDQAGHSVNNLPALCPTHGNLPVPRCLVAHGVHVHETWQPGSRFWLFQSVEAAVFISIALALAALSIWWVRRRIA